MPARPADENLPHGAALVFMISSSGAQEPGFCGQAAVPLSLASLLLAMCLGHISLLCLSNLIWKVASGVLLGRAKRVFHTMVQPAQCLAHQDPQWLSAIVCINGCVWLSPKLVEYASHAGGGPLLARK